mmetsp:Transcript_3029/g.2899  ORF Transcript_3029/g.2899 Transcript_3029/m.2899 type:complete len:213 (-) Transcript_3029:872-1510(-)
MYWKYYYYTRQGMPCSAFPYPLIGSLHRVIKYFLNVQEYQESPIIEYYNSVFNKNYPRAFIDFMSLKSTVVINDAEMVNELFIAKNKFLDKDPKFQRLQYRLLGDSILFQESNQHWAHKRKILSQAFYKDKLTKLMQIAVATILDYFNQSLDKLNPNEEVNLYLESSNLVQNCIQACIFGQKNLEKKIEFEEDTGVRKNLQSGDYLGHVVKQ